MRKGARLGVRASLAALTGVLALVLFGAGAARADTVVRTFTYTGGLQTFTAPANVVGPLTIIASVAFGGAILSEAALSFLGLGVPPPAPSWGSMLSGAGRQYE